MPSPQGNLPWLLNRKCPLAHPLLLKPLLYWTWFSSLHNNSLKSWYSLCAFLTFSAKGFCLTSVYGKDHQEHTSRGSWVAQLAKCQTFGFSSGPDFRVLSLGGLRAPQRVCWIFFLFCPSVPRPPTLSLSSK